MGIFDFFKCKFEVSVNVVKECFCIIVVQECFICGVLDYLLMMCNEFLEVIKKYVQVDIEVILINFEYDSGYEVLELLVVLFDGKFGVV